MSYTASQLFCNQGCRMNLRLLQHCRQVSLSWMGPTTGDQCRVPRSKTSAGWRKGALLHSGWAAEISSQMQTNQRGGSCSSQSARWQKPEPASPPGGGTDVSSWCIVMSDGLPCEEEHTRILWYSQQGITYYWLQNDRIEWLDVVWLETETN